mgnify:CR=1 FL=1
MKKRVLSALLALSTLLTTAPAAYAAEPAIQSDGAEIDWPEPNLHRGLQAAVRHGKL